MADGYYMGRIEELWEEHEKRPLVSHAPPNKRGRDFVVGDIHGELEMLQELMRLAQFQPVDGDRLFAVGDLIDRGPRSADVLRLTKEPWFHSVRGNHEEMMFAALVTERSNRMMQMWIGNGGRWIADFLEDEGRSAVYDLCSLVARMPLVQVISSLNGAERTNIVHAEIAGIGDRSIDALDFGPREEVEFTWGRRIIDGHGPERTENLSTTYCGHTPTQDIVRRDSHVFIDTGAFIDPLSVRDKWRLTMVNIETGEDFSVRREARH